MPLRPAPLLRFVALALVLSCSGVAAQEGADRPSAFAALDIVPAGEQRFDIATGRTELLDGGRVIDASTGIELVAERIVFVEGERIDAEGVEVVGAFGRLVADAVAIDIAAGLLTASGKLALERGALTLSAAELRYHAADEVAVFAGPVEGTEPSFEAAGLLLDTLSGTGLLLGPYRFQNGPLTLRSERDNGRLELRVEAVEGAPSYQVASEVAAETLERFADHLP